MAVPGRGAYLLRWSGSSWEELPEVNSIDGPSSARDTIETTHLRSVGGYREFISSWRDGGELTFEMNYSRDSYEALTADFESDELTDFQLVLNDGEETTFTFQALVTGKPLTIPFDDKITVSVTLKISGPVTIDSGTSSATPS